MGEAASDHHAFAAINVAAENRVIIRVINAALASVRSSILREAAKFTDGSEQEYRAGMEQAAHMIRRSIEEREKSLHG